MALAADEEFVQGGDVDMQTNGVVVELMHKYWPQCSSGQGASAATLLDIGCGTGLIGKMFMHAAERDGFFASEQARTESVLRGIDFSGDMLTHVPASLYEEALQHDVDVTPWPMYVDSVADISICNGVFIYLKNAAVLDEFARTCKPGGKCVLMFRHDVLPAFEEKRDAMQTLGKWRLLEKTPTMDNFPGLTAGGLEPTLFNVFVYEVL